MQEGGNLTEEVLRNTGFFFESLDFGAQPEVNFEENDAHIFVRRMLNPFQTYRRLRHKRHIFSLFERKYFLHKFYISLPLKHERRKCEKTYIVYLKLSYLFRIIKFEKLNQVKSLIHTLS